MSEMTEDEMTEEERIKIEDKMTERAKIIYAQALEELAEL